MNLENIRALAFDVGGTVLDWRTGLIRDLTAWGKGKGMTHDWEAFPDQWRTNSLDMALNAKQADLPRGNIDGVHRHTLAALAKERGIDAMNDEELDCLTMFWHKIPAWPDAPAAHARLRERFVMSTITILSVRMIIDISRIAPFHWDSIISCEMLEWYKFHPSSYARAAELMGFEPEEIIFVAAHNLDLKAAHDAGFHTALVIRPEEWGPTTDLNNMRDHVSDPDFEIDIETIGMTELVDRLCD